jgi:hypothetical protein
MHRHVIDAIAVNVYFATVPQRLEIFLSVLGTLTPD